MICDLRSDVLGPLSREVLTALNAAGTRAPAFTWREDIDEAALAEEAAALFGFEDSLFLPTGTLANQIAVRLWCQPGESILTDRQSHLASNEAASVAGINGAVLRLIDGVGGHPAPDQIEQGLVDGPSSAAARRVKLIWLENTHNRAGGTVMPSEYFHAISALAGAHNAALHVDGARIWHAFAAGAETSQVLLRGAGSAMVALNKIAGAPIGALLLGDRAFVDEAARVQKMFGGLWRPVGPFAAAARAALKQCRSRVEQAHETARLFATALAERCGSVFGELKPQTNIVMLRLSNESLVALLVEQARERGVRISPYRDGKIRCVFHAGVSPALAISAASVVAEVFERIGSS